MTLMVPKPPNYTQVLITLKMLESRQIQSSVEICPFNIHTQDISLNALDWNVQSYYSEIDEFIALGMSAKAEEKLVNRQAEIADQVINLALPRLVLNAIKELQNIRKQRVVLVIHTDQIELDIVPWELISLPQALSKFGLRPLFTVIRGLEINRLTLTDLSRENSRPPSIMMVSSSPLQENAPNALDEFETIKKSITLSKRKIPHHEFYNIPYGEFVSELKDKDPTILHFALHGDHGTLQFKRFETTESISPARFIDAFSNANKIRLAVFNVCYSSETKLKPAEKSLARHLAERGVLGVIGMATQITPLASLIFSETFYRELGLGASTIEAYGKAVDALREYSTSDHILWSVPMLYNLIDTEPFAILDLPEGWPVEYIQDLLELIDEFNRAINKLNSTGTIATFHDWENKAMPLRFVLPSLINHVNNLPENLPRTAHKDVLGRVLNIKDSQEKTQHLLNVFQSIFAELLSPPKAGRLNHDRYQYFITLGSALRERLSELYNILI